MEIKNLLIINLGSSSKKYSFYQGDALAYSAYFEAEGAGFHVNEGGGDEQIDTAGYQHALGTVFARVEAVTGVLQKDIHAIGIRVVAPGNFFAAHKKIDDAYTEALRHISKEVALHADLVLTEIAMVRSIAPEIPLYALSDSAFHHTMPLHARTYGLPIDLAKKYDLYRFGYHGLSAASVVTEAGKLFVPLPSRIIICHLGSGGSITAVKDGKSIDTSMGFSPLEGLVMSSRVGSIDAGAILTILEREQMAPEALRTMLYKRSGLLGVSGISEDMRILIAENEKGSAAAREAIDLFVYRVQLLIGAYTVALGGLDLLIFTGTMGERSEFIRGRVCAGLSSLGITPDSPKVAVIHIDEAAQMKHDLLTLL